MFRIRASLCIKIEMAPVSLRSTRIIWLEQWITLEALHLLASSATLTWVLNHSKAVWAWNLTKWNKLDRISASDWSIPTQEEKIDLAVRTVISNSTVPFKLIKCVSFSTTWQGTSLNRNKVCKLWCRIPVLLQLIRNPPKQRWSVSLRLYKSNSPWSD